MRGITRDALTRMGLASQSWEYASEMVLKSVRMDLKTSEVPVTFLKDRDGRVSHHKRSGWFSPFQAAWINLRAMFVYGADFFLLKPGMALFTLGLVLTAPLTFGNVTIGAVHFSLYWMLLFMTMTIVGLQAFYFGVLAQALSDYSGRARARWIHTFDYTPWMFLSGAAILLGFGSDLWLATQYVSSGLVLPPAHAGVYHTAVTGLLMAVMGFSTFGFVLVLHATGIRYGRVDVGDE
jgi:hypothetical protein